MNGRAHAFDFAERTIIVVLYAWLCVRLGASFHATHQLGSLLILVSEGLVLLFLLVRRGAQELSLAPREWALALLASAAPLVVHPGGHPLVPSLAGASLIVMGILVQLHGKLTLGRSFGCVPAHRGLKLDGPYRLVRHPIYAGYLISHTGFVLLNPTWWNLAAYVVCYALQIPRLIAEERFLAHDAAYAAYLERVRWRLVPGVF